MEIRGKKLELKRGKSVLNKVSVSTVATVATRTRVVGAREAAGKVAVSIAKEPGVGVAPEVSGVRVIEPVAPAPVPEEGEFMEEGLTSPW